MSERDGTDEGDIASTSRKISYGKTDGSLALRILMSLFVPEALISHPLLMRNVVQIRFSVVDTKVSNHTPIVVFLSRLYSAKHSPKGIHTDITSCINSTEILSIAQIHLHQTPGNKPRNSHHSTTNKHHPRRDQSPLA